MTLAMLADAFVADDISTISAKRPIWWPHSPPTTGRANNGGTEAINGLIELHRRIARDFTNRENYRLRMAPHRRRTRPNPPQVKRPLIVCLADLRR